ncbi:MAG: restriction endonuclease subunit S [Melioribacteraceae bacterium]|nr:restriction endonuclease subunit S [Melioribacteraceae bacterium]MCF8413016.1 restriction endonuclease subunit S [Melioribacteraceae bacterium]
MKKINLTKYNQYKDSRIKGLNTVPSHWAEVRIKNLAILERGKFTHRPRNDPQMYGGNYPFIQTGEVARAIKFITQFRQTLSEKGIKVSKEFKNGTLLMAIAANIGDVAIVNFDTYVPDSIVGFTPIKSDVNFLFYLFYATKPELDRVKVTSTQDNLNLERLNTLLRYSPPLPEQTAIANYLDEKTSLIDKKINLLTQKAEKYKELKQSLINETVTRGLDKTVKLKEIGVEWIGKVPEHWEVKRGKEFVTFQKGKTPSEFSADNSFLPYLSMEYLRGKQTKSVFVEPDINLVKIDANKVLVLWDGANAGEIILSKEGYISSTMAVVNENKMISNSFLYFMLKSLEKVFKDFSNGTTIPHFTPSVLLNNVYGVPALNEQKQIVKYLKQKTHQINVIIDTINTQIEKLQELRKTLINDVVTGKIKVYTKED